MRDHLAWHQPLRVSIFAICPMQNVFRLRFGDLQLGLQLPGLGDLGENRSRGHALAHFDRECARCAKLLQNAVRARANLQ